jgi:hypothetical protein
MTTLGAPSGGLKGLIGGKEALCASIAIFPFEGMSGTGRISGPDFSGSCAIVISPFDKFNFSITYWCSRKIGKK